MALPLIIAGAAAAIGGTGITALAWTIVGRVALAMAGSWILTRLVRGIILAIGLIGLDAVKKSDNPLIQAIFSPEDYVLDAVAQLSSAAGQWGAYLLWYTDILAVISTVLYVITAYIAARFVIPGL